MNDLPTFQKTFLALCLNNEPDTVYLVHLTSVNHTRRKKVPCWQPGVEVQLGQS